MKKLFTILILLTCSLLTHAQELSVKSFHLAETDLTAMTAGTKVDDQNGNPCALVKLETTIDGFTFDVGVLGIRETRRVGGEIWIYVPFGVRKITLSHPQLGVIRNYPFPCSIEKGRTYIMKLNSAWGNRTYDSSRKQKMVLKAFPADAHVEINGIDIALNNKGVLEQDFSFGVYEVVVSAPKYHTERRTVEINNPTDAHEFHFRLKQAFGWLQIAGDGDEELTVDGQSMEFVPNGRTEIMSGNYQIQLKKPYYKTFQTSVQVKDSSVCEIKPDFEVNYRDLEFRVADEAQIWIDDIQMGVGRWKGKVLYGTHRVECRKESHRNSELILNVNPQTYGPILLESPKPIYGELRVSSTPAGAQIYVDGKYVGTTPTSIQTIIGERKVEIKRAGYSSETAVIEVKEGATSNVSMELSDMISVRIKSAPTARLYIDGKQAGRTPWTDTLVAGNHRLRLEASKYYDYEKNIIVDGEHKEFNLKMRRRYFKPFNLYVSAEYQILGTSGIKGSVGAFVKNINIEANFVYGLNRSDVIYWNIPEQMTRPSGYTYNPLLISGRVGYGLTAVNRLRITPQAGIGILMLKGLLVEAGTSDPLATDGYSIPVMAGCRFDIAVAPSVAVTLTPNYCFAIAESELYKQVSSVSDVVGGYASGLTLGLGVSFIF